MTRYEVLGVAGIDAVAQIDIDESIAEAPKQDLAG